MNSEHITIRILDNLKQEMIKDGLITEEQLKTAEKEAALRDEGVGSILIEKRFITSEKILNFIEERLHIPYVKLEDYEIDKNAIKLIPVAIARNYKVIPLFEIENVLTVAMADPLNIISLDRIINETKHPVEAVISSEASILSAIEQCYGLEEAKEYMAKELTQFIEEGERTGGVSAKEVTERISNKIELEGRSIVRLVNGYIIRAVLEGASDIHFEPKKDSMRVRFRIDGFLHDRDRLPVKLISTITSRIKVVSALDISKKLIPQNGRISFVCSGKNIDIRTSTHPTLYGENIVLRILKKTHILLSLHELGFSDEDLNIFKRAILAPNGMILATGPTGSGKTTTIYSAINAIDKSDKNIMTIEDPIEYEIEGTIQSQVNNKAGIMFANALRSILRQDPDVIYVGEIRDTETAEVAVSAALTGHLVFSTLHTRGAVGTIARLLDLGIKPWSIASALNCVFTQRLVRKICKKCIKEYQPDEDIAEEFGFSSGAKFYMGEGCESCNNIGYKGRVGIFEILVVNHDIRRLVSKGASEMELMESAKAQGMKTLFEDGMMKVMKGITTLDELRRVALEA
ncbi:MAG: ATPase, T2SS/T4P/T4SS family [Nitrospirota bacterium]